jgi:hypothetical protein
MFEIHKEDSLNNRFLPIEPITTNAILSVDDDLVVPCNDLTQAMRVWLSNRKAMVGFSPRMTVFDVYSGKARYLRWQHTWWNGLYTLMLTKVSIFHKDYLADYFKMVPSAMLEHIKKHRNCEDIAMAHIIAQKSGVPPVWVKGSLYETGTTGGGISSGGSHFVDRSACVDMLKAGTGQWPWVVSLQKAIPIGWGVGDWLGFSDYIQLSFDRKGY